MLLHEIEPLFGAVKQPRASELGAPGSEEWVNTLNRLASKTWRNVALDDFDSQGGLLETVSVLSAKGILYFLPGLLRLALYSHDEGDRYLITSALLNVFTHPANSKCSREQALVLSHLSGPQRGFLIRFFDAAQRQDSTICPEIVRAAVASLQAGEAVPYSQQQVRAWASQFASSHADVERRILPRD
jgi:hypothetical protein